MWGVLLWWAYAHQNGNRELADVAVIASLASFTSGRSYGLYTGTYTRRNTIH